MSHQGTLDLFPDLLQMDLPSKQFSQNYLDYFWHFVFSEKSAIDHIFINISKCVHIILYASTHKINICLSLLR